MEKNHVIAGVTLALYVLATMRFLSGGGLRLGRAKTLLLMHIYMLFTGACVFASEFVYPGFPVRQQLSDTVCLFLLVLWACSAAWVYVILTIHLQGRTLGILPRAPLPLSLDQRSLAKDVKATWYVGILVCVLLTVVVRGHVALSAITSQN